VAQFDGTARSERDHLVREVCVVRGLLRITEQPEGFDHGVLRIGLTRVNDVVNRRNAAEVRMIALAVLGRNPHLPPLGIAVEFAITEVQAQQAELPKMIGNVLANVADFAVGTHDDLRVFVGAGLFLRTESFLRWVPHPLALLWRKGGIATLRRGGPLHYPATFVFAFGLEIKDAHFFELLEGRIPEVQAEDLAFAWEEIVLDVETIHGLKMTTRYGGRDQLRGLSHVIATVLYSM